MHRTIIQSLIATFTFTFIVGTSAMVVASPAAPVRRCAPDAVVVGSTCLDFYEASVWRVPDSKAANALLASRIRRGMATRAELIAGGATQLGIAADDYAPCADDGENCGNDIFALSLPDEIPSSQITWFQAQEACANSGKRLPTNAEWQVGANGTPDPGPDDGIGDCNTTTGSASHTGARFHCVSARGAFDMVGNLTEWVADWAPRSTECPGWGGFSDDFMCLAGASTTANGPGALLRGGDFMTGSGAGPLAVFTLEPSHSADLIGFRCAR
jgi:formylglycine-generating enzyme required for sulfatase activity